MNVNETGLVRNVPHIPFTEVESRVNTLYGIKGDYTQLNSERDLCYRIKLASSQSYVLKISNAAEPEGIVDFQVKALDHLASFDEALPIPRMVRTTSNQSYDWIEGKDGHRYMIRLLTFLEGDVLEDVYATSQNKASIRYNLGAFIARMGVGLRNFHHPYAQSNCHLWDVSGVVNLRDMASYIQDISLREQCFQVLDYAEETVLPKLARTRHQVIHQDAHQGNVLVSANDPTHIAGVIDFGDMLYGSIVSDLVIAADCYLEEETDPLQVLCEVCAGYDSVTPLEEDEIDLVYDMSLLRLINTVIVLSARDEEDQEETHLANTGKHARMLKLMLQQGRREGIRRLREACRFPVYSAGELNEEDHIDLTDELVAQRKNVLGDVWHFYERPLHFVKGQGAWLYASDGQKYLDAYNNVPQVGHSHPHVVKSVARQAAVLNTNTRYITNTANQYAERLLATLPTHFDACLFVNSGSEANDIAAQIATFISKGTGAIVMDRAYHGVTQGTVRLSPVTCKHYGGDVAYLDVPDMYRGKYTNDRDAADKYARDCDRAIMELDKEMHWPGFFMVDTALCTNGIPTAPEGYFEKVAQKVRTAGGLVIADEVQAGLGRLGQMWGVQEQGLESVDIITLGKPVGNGHPLGVVLTNKEMLNAFNSHSEVFSTFGGNNVSCAAGMAVLDVIERENLLNKSNVVGDYFRDQLRKLALTHQLIGDVRGKGMLVAVEFVDCRTKKTPATDKTEQIVETMKEKGVLIGRSGADKNILKLRPNFAWDEEKVDLFIQALKATLEEIG